jgi:predicted translation initiation factor SUI1
MGKKHRPTPPIPVAKSSELTHSPFAGLSARAVAPVPTAESATHVGGAASAIQADGGAPEVVAVRSRGRLVLRRETKHRGGKAVVIVSGFSALRDFDERAIAELAKDCKQTLGCGGTVEDSEIVLQGDRPAQVADLLRGKGFRVGGVK